jgi:hypothetical protein
MKLEFSQQIFEKKAQITRFIKIRLLGTEFFQTDRQTDMTKLIVAFRNFSNAPKNVNMLPTNNTHVRLLCGVVCI